MPSLLHLEPHTTGRSYQMRAVPLAYEEAARQQFKSMPGVRWQRDPTAPNGRGYFYGCGAALALVVRTLEAAGVVKSRVAAAAAVPPSARRIAAPHLRAYQLTGAEWLLRQLETTGGALLGDEMGIGKTLQAIAALDALDDLGAASRIVVCPAVVRAKWAREAAKWSHTPAAWHVFSYEGFQKAVRKGQLPPDAALVIDEAHYIANPKAARSKALAAWRAVNPDAHVIALTGTPIPAHISDLWHPLDLLHPGRWGSKWDFEKRYCDGRFVEIPNTEKSVWQAKGASRLEELHERLAVVLLARSKAQVALELPGRERVAIEVEIPKKALRDLQRAATVIDWHGGQTRQGAGISTLLSNVESYKLEAAVQLARDCLANGHRPLLLTTRIETARQLGRELNCPQVDGETPADKREAILREATEGAGVATLYSVTTGIDLVDYDVIIFTGLDWLPSTLLQGEGRIHRIGQAKPVTIYYLIGAHTIDEVVRERVIDRLDIQARAIGADASEGLAGALGAENDDQLLAALVAAVGEAA